MPNPKLRLGFREPEIDTNRPFVEGTVKVEGFNLEISNLSSSMHGTRALADSCKPKGKATTPMSPFPLFRTENSAWLIFMSTALRVLSPRKTWRASGCLSAAPPASGLGVPC